MVLGGAHSPDRSCAGSRLYSHARYLRHAICHSVAAWFQHGRRVSVGGESDGGMAASDGPRIFLFADHSGDLYWVGSYASRSGVADGRFGLETVFLLGSRAERSDCNSVDEMGG